MTLLRVAMHFCQPFKKHSFHVTLNKVIISTTLRYIRTTVKCKVLSTCVRAGGGGKGSIPVGGRCGRGRRGQGGLAEDGRTQHLHPR